MVSTTGTTPHPTDPTDLFVPGPHGPVPVRVFWGEGRRALLWCHGGAFAFGDLDMPEAAWTARQVVERTGLTVVTPDYRLVTPLDAPARWPVRWPVPSDDVLAAWTWLVERAADLAPDGVLLGGASAGANLAAGAVLRMAGDTPRPQALFLAYPTLHSVQPAPSAELVDLLAALPPEERWGPAEVLAMYRGLLGPEQVDDPPAAAVPGHCVPADLRDVPRTLVLLSEVDGLRPSGEDFAAKLAAAGVDVRVHLEPGTTHGHLNEPQHPGAARSLDVLADWIGVR